MLSTLERARRYVAKCPPAISGQGGHNATFHVASVLVHGFALVEADAMILIREWNRSCVPSWTEAELVHKIKSAANATHKEARGHLASTIEERPDVTDQRTRAVARLEIQSKPVFQPMVLKRVAAKVASVGDAFALAKERSPVSVDTQDSASVLRRLYAFRSGETVLVFSDMKSQGQMLWNADKSDVIQNRHLPTGENGVWFLPQPVDGKFHPNPRSDGRRSRRSEESVIAWRFAVLESDKADPEDWLRCLIQMPLRIASVCESGGRSIHALVRVDADSKADWDTKIATIKPVLITLGADVGSLSAVRLTRLPQATRGERVQRLWYLNTEPDGLPILEHAPRPAAGRILHGEAA